MSHLVLKWTPDPISLLLKSSEKWPLTLRIKSRFQASEGCPVYVPSSSLLMSPLFPIGLLFGSLAGCLSLHLSLCLSDCPSIHIPLLSPSLSFQLQLSNHSDPPLGPPISAVPTLHCKCLWKDFLPWCPESPVGIHSLPLNTRMKKMHVNGPALLAQSQPPSSTAHILRLSD